MGKLNSVVALEKGIKAQSYSIISELHKLAQKSDLFTGFIKTYQKRDEESEDLPSEQKKIQYAVSGILRDVRSALADLCAITARKEWSNCAATAPIVVDGTAIADAVPVTYLLFLEKQLTDMRTFVDKLPTLDGNEDWHDDPNTGLYRTDAVQTHRTKKVQRPLVLYDATKEHPAQTQLVAEDIVAGYWNTVKHSAAMPAPQKAAMAERVEKLLRAVKEAREVANSLEEVTAPKVGDAILGYVFGK